MLRSVFASMLAVSCAAVALPGLAAPLRQEASPTAREEGNSVGVTRFGSYYEDHASNSCTATVNCILYFATTRKNVLLNSVSCLLVSANTPQTLTVSAPPKAGVGYTRLINLPVAPYGYSKDQFSGSYAYFVNFTIPINFFMQSGTQINFNYLTSGAATPAHSMNCSIIGQSQD